MILKIITRREESEELSVESENKFKEVGKDLGMDCFDHFKLDHIETYVEVDNDKITVEDLDMLVESGFVEVVSL